jgi:hypothetical protein
LISISFRYTSITRRAHLFDRDLPPASSMNGSNDDPISSLADDGHHLIVPTDAELDLSRLIGRGSVSVVLSRLLDCSGLLLDGHLSGVHSGLSLERSFVHSGFDVHVDTM